MRVKDITNQKFERLVALERTRSTGKTSYWLCLCDCGQTTEVSLSSLQTGTTKSCGCLFREKAEKGRITLICYECQTPFVRIRSEHEAWGGKHRVFCSNECRAGGPKQQPEDIDSTKYRLGRLCRNGHDHKGTGYSLRYLLCGGCVECAAEREKSDDYKQRRKTYECNASQIRSQRKRRYLQSEHGRAVTRRYAQSEKFKQMQRAYGQSERGKNSRRKSVNARRARKAQVFSMKWTDAEWQARCEQFNNCCAYCGGSPVTIEHFIALSCGGVDCLANIIPACKRCNCSKNNSDPKHWYEQQPFYSEAKWRRILRVLRKTDQNYNQLSLLEIV